MTLMGASVYETSHRTVTWTGGLWTEILRLKGSDLPDAGSSVPYVFVGWCTVGHFAAANAVVAVATAALGDQNGPFSLQSPLDFPPRQHLTWAPFQASNTPLRGIPFFFVRGYTPGFRTGWDTADDLVLWAKIDPNGDPSSLLTGASFRITDAGLLGFSLQNVGVEYFHDLYSPGAPFPGNLSNGEQNHHMSSIAGWAAGAGTWLGFSQTTYIPLGENTAPSWWTVYDAAGSFPGTRELGRGDGTNGGPIGMMARTDLDNSTGKMAVHADGGAFVRTNPASLAQFGIVGKEWSSQTPSLLVDWECFALRVDSGASSGGLGQFQHVRKDAPPGGTLKSIFNDENFATRLSEPIEITAEPTALSDLLLSVGSWFQNTIDEVSYHANAEPLLGGTLKITQQLDPWIRASTYKDSPRHNIGGRVPGYPMSGLQWNCQVDQNIGETGKQLNRRAQDFLVCGWNWENNPADIPYNLPAVPAAVAIVPGRESLDVGSLNALPNGAGGEQLLPEVGRGLQDEMARHAFEPDDGELLTWPHFLTPRRTFRLIWRGLSRADRDTLLAFFAAQADRAFKWAPPGESDTAFVVHSSPSSRDVGLVHEVTVTAVELVWTGP